MLTSLALIFLLGLILGFIFNKLKLPSLLGMLLTGIILGPYALNLLDDSILSISADLRQLALVIILMRAGLALDIEDLIKVGRPALLMCFVPACFEIIGIVLIAPKLLGISVLEAAIMGAVVAAVSPAVIVPNMLKMIDSGYGTAKKIPQLIMAGASVDNVFVIIIFTSLTSLASGRHISAISLIHIPFSIITGLVVGIIFGLSLASFFKRFHINDYVKVIILLSVSFLLIAMEKFLHNRIPLSGLLAVMSMSATILATHGILAKRMSEKFSNLWVGAEILLFVLVGATINLSNVFSAGIMAVLVILGALLFRMIGVFCCLIKTKLNKNERLFCVIAYMPKATVQAAIGSIPLAMGLHNGQIILTMAVLAIIITSPLGEVAINSTYRKFLRKA